MVVRIYVNVINIFDEKLNIYNNLDCEVAKVSTRELHYIPQILHHTFFKTVCDVFNFSKEEKSDQK